MRRKLFLTGMLGMVLAFGVVVVGCGGGSSNQAFATNELVLNDFCVVVNKRVQFYEFRDGQLKYSQSKDFVLPKGYKGVLVGGVGNLLGVVVGNKIQSYIFGNDGWTLHQHFADFVLPKEYKSVFPINSYFVGVVVGNKVQFYDRSGDDGWTVSQYRPDFVLPKGYKSVFPASSWLLGVVVGNKVQFYEVNDDDDGWIVSQDLADFVLPKGYKGGIFARGLFSIKDLGVVVGNKVQFYKPEDDGWVHYADFELSAAEEKKTTASDSLNSGAVSDTPKREGNGQYRIGSKVQVYDGGGKPADDYFTYSPSKLTLNYGEVDYNNAIILNNQPGNRIFIFGKNNEHDVIGFVRNVIDKSIEWAATAKQNNVHSLSKAIPDDDAYVTARCALKNNLNYCERAYLSFTFYIGDLFKNGKEETWLAMRYQPHMGSQLIGSQGGFILFREDDFARLKEMFSESYLAEIAKQEAAHAEQEALFE